MEKVLCVPDVVGKILTYATYGKPAGEESSETPRASSDANENIRLCNIRHSAINIRLRMCWREAQVCREWRRICSGLAHTLEAEKAKIDEELEAEQERVNLMEAEKERERGATFQRMVDFAAQLTAQGSHEAAAAILRGAVIQHAGGGNGYDSEDGGDGYDSDGFYNGPIM